MSIAVSDYEKLGAFYLGREFDPIEQKLEEGLVLYDSKDLVTHGVVLGMTGSGKTGLCMALLEEAAMDGVPAIIVDPKGDISNLLLNFPDLEASDFEPWINADDARKKDRTLSEHAEKTATMWKGGLAEWGQSGERMKALQEKVDVNVFTPGSKAGIPVSILSSLDVPPFEVMDDGELLGERIESTVSSLLALVGVDADPIQSQEAVFLGNIFQHSWAKEQALSLESLIRHIQRPGFDKIGVLDLDSFINEKKRQSLAMKFNSLLASPGFATWLEGPPLDIQTMLYTPEGKPRMSIFSIAHLGDAERMFFVSLLLNQQLGWMRSQNGTTSLRAMFYMDEIFGYLPPTANPPSKKPLMTMLKQGRAFGLGCLLATQNPVDLDYKALSNIGTWWLGRLQTERDQLRVLDGLESAASSLDGGFARKEMEKILSGIQSRVFVMNNVHDDGPIVMHVRWVMSYLCGPLSRRQLKKLMDPKRDAFDAGEVETKKVPGNPMAMSSSPKTPVGSTRPIVGKGVVENFVPFAGEPDGVIYKPSLLRQANVHFSSSKAGVDGERMVRTISSMSEQGIDWEDVITCTVPLKSLDSEPRQGVGFDELPGFAMNKDNYKPVEDDFEEWLYRNERVEVFYTPQYKAYSQMGEGEGGFRGRLAVIGREQRDEAVEKLREKYEKKIDSQMKKLRQAELRMDKEEAEASSATWQAGASVIGGLLGGLLGGRRSRRSGMTSATRAFKQRKDVAIAKDKIKAIEEQICSLETELEQEIEELNEDFDAATTKLETTSIKPYKKDIFVENIGLLWLPYDEDGEPVW